MKSIYSVYKCVYKCVYKVYTVIVVLSFLILIKLKENQNRGDSL